MRWALLIASISIIAACDSEPTNYDDCIFKYVSDAKTREAAIFLRHSCRNKFPSPKVQSEADKEFLDALENFSTR